MMAAFILNEDSQNYKKLGYFPLSSKIMNALVVCKYHGIFTHKQMIDCYKQLVNEQLAL